MSWSPTFSSDEMTSCGRRCITDHKPGVNEACLSLYVKASIHLDVNPGHGDQLLNLSRLLPGDSASLRHIFHHSSQRISSAPLG